MLVLETLYLAKVFFDIGIYDKVCGHIGSIDDCDYNELVLLGLEKIAPSCRHYQEFMDNDGKLVKVDQMDDAHLNQMDCWNDVYAYSSPEMKEYHRLCKAYSKKHSIPLQTNKYFRLAVSSVDTYRYELDNGANIRFDNLMNASELLVEWPVTDFYPRPELFMYIHNIFEFYKNNIEKLRLELASGPGGMPNGKHNL